VVLGEVGEAEEVDGEEEQLVCGAEREQDFLRGLSAHHSTRTHAQGIQTLLE
jgi:hypothetical protein